jgi:hypothetical protein
MIKYLRYNERVNDCLTTDTYGNRIHKASGAYAIVVETIDKPTHVPMSLTKLDGQWVPMQMELDFG